MSDVKPPAAYERFIERFPHLGKAWELIHEEGDKGTLDEKSRRLIRLATAIGAGRTGAVRANVRKARALGIEREEIEQVVALSAGTIGMPGAVAAFTWIDEIFGSDKN